MFCAKRVAGCSGDARQALDLARRAMDLAHQRCTSTNIPEFTVTVADIAQVVNSVFGSALNDLAVPTGGDSKGPTGPGLPLHERLALVAIINSVANASNEVAVRKSIGGRGGRKAKNDSSCSLMKVYGTYTAQCREHSIDPLSQSDFTDVCGRLADKRLLAVTPAPAKQPLAGPSICLRVTIDEMRDFLAKNSLCNMMMTTIDENDD